jgi:hypothetical protein
LADHRLVEAPFGGDKPAAGGIPWHRGRHAYKPYGWTFEGFCSYFVLMPEQRFKLLPLDPKLGTIAPGLTLVEAFTRVMAIAGRDYSSSVPARG